MFDGLGGGDNGLAVWFLRQRIVGDSFGGRDTALAGTFDRLVRGDTVLSVWFLRDKITGNRGFAVGIHRREHKEF
ncbi:hypothetical protein Bca4012_073842 [Brassica carinata]